MPKSSTDRENRVLVIGLYSRMGEETQFVFATASELVMCHISPRTAVPYPETSLYVFSPVLLPLFLCCVFDVLHI
jgi:hypothetical protein